jgi:hypothetical protein
VAWLYPLYALSCHGTQPPSKAELKKRAEEIRAKQAKYAKAVQAQDEKIAENYAGLTEHLEELASGALVTTESGLPHYVEVERAEAPEAERLEAEYQKAVKQQDPVTMHRVKTRLAEVKAMDAEYESARVREMEQALGMADHVSYDEGRETVEEELDETDYSLEPFQVYAHGGYYLVQDEDGYQAQFTSQEDAEEYIEDPSGDELSNWTKGVKSRSTMPGDQDD